MRYCGYSGAVLNRFGSTPEVEMIIDVSFLLFYPQFRLSEYLVPSILRQNDW